MPGSESDIDLWSQLARIGLSIIENDGQNSPGSDEETSQLEVQHHARIERYEVEFQAVIDRDHDFGADLKGLANSDPEPGIQGEPSVIERALTEEICLNPQVEADNRLCFLALRPGESSPDKQTHHHQNQ